MKNAWIISGKQDDKKDVELCRLAPFSILVYSHAIHWVIHLITDQYLKKEHKRNRLNGYIEFYLQTVSQREEDLENGTHVNFKYAVNFI